MNGIQILPWNANHSMRNYGMSITGVVLSEAFEK